MCANKEKSDSRRVILFQNLSEDYKDTSVKLKYYWFFCLNF